MNAPSELVASLDEIIQIRHDLHAHPELGYEEIRTADLIADKLTQWGIPFHRGLGVTGIVATLQSGDSRRSIGLRADMDALPILEKNEFPHKSKNVGKMHGCGHDGHVAMLLGAARHLAQHRDFDGIVHFIFQPAEEGNGAGARAMIKDGLFEKFPCDAVYGLHNWPGLPQGSFAVRPGPLLASNNDFRITVNGKGSHAAMPHLGNDPLFAATQIVGALQSVVSRNKKPIDTAVLSVTQFHGGTVSNVIPDNVWIGGTVRTFSTEVLDLVESRMAQIAKSIAWAFDCTVDFEFSRNYPATVNSPAETATALEIMRDLIGADNVDDNIEPTMGAEDFAFMLQEKPGCYALLGNGNGDHRAHGHGLGPCMLHNPSYDFNDGILNTGMSYWVKLVQHCLAK